MFLKVKSITLCYESLHHKQFIMLCLSVCAFYLFKGGLLWPLQWWPQARNPEDMPVQIQRQAGGGWYCRTGRAASSHEPETCLYFIIDLYTKV